MEGGGDTKPTRLGRSDWISAALEVIAAQGVGGVSVEGLAARLGVTKGSFYWHFASRGELVRATLEDWAIRRTEERIEQLAAAADPRHRLGQLVGTAGGTIDPMDIHFVALQPDAGIRAALDRHHRLWLDFAKSIYRELGFADDVAALRGLLAYSSYLGLVVLHGSDPAGIEAVIGTATDEAIVEALMPSCDPGSPIRPSPTGR